MMQIIQIGNTVGSTSIPYMSETLVTPERYYNINIRIWSIICFSTICNKKIMVDNLYYKDSSYVYQNNTRMPNLDFEHTINGENGRASAGAHRIGETVRVTRVFETPVQNGVYTAKVEVYNPQTNNWIEKGPKTTMFPDNWSDLKTKWEINGAWNSSDFKLKQDRNGLHWEGTSPSGIKIEGYVKNARTTVYPEYGGGQ